MSNLDATPYDEDFAPAPVDIHSIEPGLRAAVSYLRVSTREQAERGGQDEGFSIPAQRLANHRKAASMGAAVVAEFVDAGESARKADRPQLQAMLEYVAENDVSYCIVHKVDRLARNRVDDVEINLALGRAGVKLVSATENIDETPSGMLLHGIMSTIAEFYSRNLGNEVSKGLTQKAMSGGTVTRAPLGYKNVRHIDALGRENRTIEVDPERAPLVRWAFDTYATGDWSLMMLRDELTQRGLLTRPTPKHPAKPLMISNLHEMLRNPYYIGEIVYRGESYAGTHEQLIDRGVWQQVQDVLAAHNHAGDRQRVHEHYLKGSVFCGSCGSRLTIMKIKNNYGTEYEYFACLGRHTRRTDCKRQSMPLAAVEQVVERAWQRLRLTYDERVRADDLITRALSDLAKTQGKQRADLESQREALLAERSKLLAAHYADAIPLSLLKIEQDRIASTMALIDEQLEGQDASHATVMKHLAGILNLLQHCGDAYVEAAPQIRRLLNQAFAEKIYVDEDGSGQFELELTVELIRGAAVLPLTDGSAPKAKSIVRPRVDPAPPGQPTINTPPKKNSRGNKSSGVLASLPLFSGSSLNKPVLVGLTGFEPATP